MVIPVALPIAPMPALARRHRLVRWLRAAAAELQRARRASQRHAGLRAGSRAGGEVTRAIARAIYGDRLPPGF